MAPNRWISGSGEPRTALLLVTDADVLAFSLRFADASRPSWIDPSLLRRGDARRPPFVPILSQKARVFGDVSPKKPGAKALAREAGGDRPLIKTPPEAPGLGSISPRYLAITHRYASSIRFSDRAGTKSTTRGLKGWGFKGGSEFRRIISQDKLETKLTSLYPSGLSR